MENRGPILVTGATGETGRRVVDRLRDADVAVRVLVRDGVKARRVLGESIDAHLGDIRRRDSLDGMADGVKCVIHTIGTRTYFGANGGAAVDVEGTRNLVETMRGSGARLVFLSAFGVGRRSPFLSLFSAVLGNYFRHKTEAERLVRESDLAYTIVRPVELRNRPPRGAPLLNQNRPLSLLRTVSRATVADVLVASAFDARAVGRTFELCEGGRGTIGEQLSGLVPDDAFDEPARTPLF